MDTQGRSLSTSNNRRITMSSYNPAIPQATDLMSVSQGDLLNNFSSANTSFGQDHYAFANLTTNNGKHNQVRTPLIVGGIHPTTIAAEPNFYAMQDSANIGVIQYSRGPSNAVPSPVTYFQSPSTPIVLAQNTTTNVLDFTGLPRAMAKLYAYNLTGGNLTFADNESFVLWNGTTLTVVQNNTSTANLGARSSGNILQLVNGSVIVGTMMNIIWTLQLLRLS
jgi:hypothetical protein